MVTAVLIVAALSVSGPVTRGTLHLAADRGSNAGRSGVGGAAALGNHGIISAFGEGIAAKDSPQPHEDADQGAPDLHGFDEVP